MNLPGNAWNVLPLVPVALVLEQLSALAVLQGSSDRIALLATSTCMQLCSYCEAQVDIQ